MKNHFARLGFVVFIGFFCFVLGAVSRSAVPKNPITRKIVSNAEKLFGLNFSDKKRDMMLEDLNDQLKNYQNLRKVTLPNRVPPAILLNPIPAGFEFEKERKEFVMSPVPEVEMPSNIEDLAFDSVEQLASLIKSRRVTSEQLTRMYLSRLKRYGPKLECVITLTEDLAIRQAKQADAEIAAGKYRGPLHGIPYGAKDLLATKGIRTTWGSVPFKDQMIDQDATVIRRLQDAGAVLVAKLTMGELAWGDVWYGGMTRNPWKYDEGSSGSSAGSASATSAGLVAFAIGTETWGSILSPSTRCGVSGLRPTYGRVSRNGAMALSWSMDKIGSICRRVEDCAVVFNAIYGPDGVDQTLYDAPFNYQPDVSFKNLRIGYLKKDFDEEKNDAERKSEDDLDTSKQNDQASLAKLREMGANLIPIELPKLPLNDMAIILSAESAAAFDDLTRSGKDDLLKRQVRNAWPNVFRASRFIPAVEYIQANRVRYLLIQEMAKLMKDVDLYISPTEEGDNQLLTNLSGHPCVVVPNGFSKQGTPTSISFTGRLFGEAQLLAVARQYQEATGFHLKHPTLHE